MVHYKFLTHFLCIVLILISASSACLGDISDSSRLEHSHHKSDGLDGLYVNAKDSDGNTALIRASRDGQADVVERLLIEGADVNAKSKSGYTALMLASRRGRADIVKLLLEQKGIEVNAKDSDGDTALMRASRNEHTDITETAFKRRC